MNKETRQIVTNLLRPLVRYCLRSSLHIQEINDLLKRLIVTEAALAIRESGKRVNVSRISAMTGVHRKDVTRFLDDPQAAEGDTRNLLSRVIALWETDSRYLNDTGAPRPLSSTDEFYELVSEVSKDLNPGTILSELERTGLVRQEDGYATLIDSSFLIRDNFNAGIALAAADISDLYSAAEYNSSTADSVKHLHARTEYDNVYKEDLPKIREWLLKKGADLHKEVRAFLAAHDHDIQRNTMKEPGGKVVVGTFSFTAVDELE